MKIEMLRIFSKITYDGWIKPPALISFGKRPIEWKTEDMENGMRRWVKSKYRYDLEIDLWLLKFYFRWDSL